MKDKIYPAIYESVDGRNYVYSDAKNYYSFECKRWDISNGDDNHTTDTNISREYLQNTYGEVQSPEHAEFIIELAELHGFERTIYQEKRKYFAFVDNVLIFLVNPVYDREDKKQITIPLPPKADKQDVSEWPQVGDDVKTSDGTGIVELLPDTKGYYVVSVDGEYYQYQLYELIKPKTPEEELRDELKFDIEYLLAAYEKPSIITEKLLEKYDIKKKPQ